MVLFLSSPTCLLVVLLCGFTLDIKYLTALCTANHQITARNMSHAI